MNVDLKPESKQLFQARVDSGQYNDAGDVIAAGLKALSEKKIEAEALKKAEGSFARFEAGAPARPWSEVKAEMEALL